ncbi:hypothetical protein ACFQ1M_00880 [Sungkyunkwania multivorans]|uniref:Lipocalin-like domain-containing protein n=1 Tax=Sungkyunkwania multivorans TaxID=1173618 RepID=A0ABW3CSJ4_9FLAO
MKIFSKSMAAMLLFIMAASCSDPEDISVIEQLATADENIEKGGDTVNTESIIDFMTSSPWIVTFYGEIETDSQNSLEGHTFNFKGDNTVLVSSMSTEETGLWFARKDKRGMIVNISFAKSSNLHIIQGDWVVSGGQKNLMELKKTDPVTLITTMIRFERP